MKKVLVFVMTLGLISVFAAETEKPASTAPRQGDKTIVEVERTVIKVEAVEKKVVRQVKKDAKKDSKKM